MKVLILSVITVVCILNSQVVSAWDSEELEIFDLVEEINENFYKILNIEQVHTYNFIRKKSIIFCDIRIKTFKISIQMFFF